jgi:hypothetical protein
MSVAMETVYYRLIKAGVKIISEVPQNLREAVQALLDKDAQENPEG